MKVLLISPPVPVKTIMPERYQNRARLFSKLGGDKPILGVQPPYGVLYLSAYLKKAGHQVFFLDGFFNDVNAMIALMKRENIRLVGLTAVSYHWQKGVDALEAIRQAIPDCFIVVGGAHANAVKGDVLHDSEAIDCVAFGDGEETLVEIVARLESGTTDMDGIRGTITRDADNGERPSIKDLDGMLLADRSLIQLQDYRPSPFYYRRLPFTAIIGSRGCPYRCTFCHTETLTRLRSPESLVEEIEHLQRNYGVREVVFYDDTFTLNKRRVYQFCELLLRRGISLSWSANARCDSIDRDLLRAMKGAGCWRLLFGIESGNQKTLDSMLKNESLDEIRRGIRMTQDAGIDTYGMFILGYPGESYADGLNTIQFAQELKLDYANFCAVTPFPGTKLYQDVKESEGFRGYETMSMFDVSYVSEDVTEAEIKDLVEKSSKRFYLRPDYVASRLTPEKLSSWEDLKRYGRGFAMVLSDISVRT
ncbi:MAG: radical SAM protein [Myxococcota bacterium]|nr:radical SAM protein [Myxococcota bacterium]